jgi:F-type H+-transporting ATPase subunit b
MSLVSFASILAEEDPSKTHHWLLPESAEIIYGGLASLIIFAALIKFGLPLAKKGLAARTERIQRELDAAATAKASAVAEAERIRAAKGDIGAERERLLAEADAQAASVVSDGRTRVDAEARDLLARADAEIQSTLARTGDELRAEIARMSSDAAERAVRGALDDSLQRELVEQYIQRVGASS